MGSPVAAEASRAVVLSSVVRSDVAAGFFKGSPSMSSHQRPFHQIGRIFAGADVFVVGMGSSLEGFDWSSLEGRFTIVLNNAVRYVPSPSIHLFADQQLWKRYEAHVYAEETRIVCQKGALDSLLKARPELIRQLFEFKQNGRPELVETIIGPASNQLYVARTVATAGIQLAHRLGASRIFLLGVDGYRRADGAYYADGEAKPVQRNKVVKRPESGVIVEAHHGQWDTEMGRIRKTFSAADLYPGPFPGAGIYNLNPISTISSWEKVDVGDVIRSSSV